MTALWSWPGTPAEFSALEVAVGHATNVTLCLCAVLQNRVCLRCVTLHSLLSDPATVARLLALHREPAIFRLREPLEEAA